MHDGRVLVLALSEMGTMLAAEAGGTVRAWDLDPGKQLADLDAEDEAELTPLEGLPPVFRSLDRTD